MLNVSTAALHRERNSKHSVPERWMWDTSLTMSRQLRVMLIRRCIPEIKSTPKGMNDKWDMLKSRGMSRDGCLPAVV